MVTQLNDNSKITKTRRILVHSAGLLIALIGVLVLVRITFGQFVMEKILTELALPCGLIWLGIGFAWYLVALERMKICSVVVGLVFVLYTAAGNPYAGDWLLSTLERGYYDVDPFGGDTLDVLVVLGGGTSKLNTGQVQLGSNGDRIAMAARLYHHGKAHHVVTTGSSFSRAGFEPLGGAKSAARILEDLQVPRSAISLISGKNTSEELGQLQRFLETNAADRVGILSSAWHLPRVERLARRHGLELDPVPADFRTNSFGRAIMGVIPDDDGFGATSIAVKEYLAWLVNR